MTTNKLAAALRAMVNEAPPGTIAEDTLYAKLRGMFDRLPAARATLAEYDARRKLAHPRFVVDGHESEDDDALLLGDGEYPPFLVFDTLRQQYVPGLHTSRAQAEAIAAYFNQP
jgi:hypothetical protein